LTNSESGWIKFRFNLLSLGVARKDWNGKQEEDTDQIWLESL